MSPGVVTALENRLPEINDKFAKYKGETEARIAKLQGEVDDMRSFGKSEPEEILKVSGDSPMSDVRKEEEVVGSGDMVVDEPIVAANKMKAAETLVGLSLAGDGVGAPKDKDSPCVEFVNFSGMP